MPLLPPCQQGTAETHPAQQQQQQPEAVQQPPQLQQVPPSGQQQPAAAAATPAKQQPVFPGITRLTLELDLASQDTDSSSGNASSSRRDPDPQAVATFCSTLSAALPGLKALELEWPRSMALPSLAAWSGLTSLRLCMTYPARLDAPEELQVAEVAAVLDVLRDVPEVQQLVLMMQVPEGRQAWLRQEVQAVLPCLTDFRLDGSEWF
jgi:hypothetical protein